MSKMKGWIDSSALVNERVKVDEGVSIGPMVIFCDDGVSESLVGRGAVIEAGAVIGAGVNVGRGARVRPGAVLLTSAPPNAIIEGNPALVVGYTHKAPGAAAASIAGTPDGAPGVRPLNVGGAQLHTMRRITDLRGALTVGEVNSDLPFAPQRYFVVFDVPSRELRGEHAHKVCHQFLLCVSGSVGILLDDGTNRCEVRLDAPNIGVYMPPMIWGTQYRYTKDAVLLVFASHKYDADDYIRYYGDFLEAVKHARQS